MPELPVDVAVLARRLADALATADIPYAIGGALAYGQWGLPRGTSDVDLTLFLEEAEWPLALRLLEGEGARLDAPAIMAELRERGASRLVIQGLHVDVFVPSIPFYESVRPRVVDRPLLGRPARFLAAEDLAVFKLLFFRPKDLVDVQYMLATRGAAFDRDYVRGWLVNMLGEDDERLRRWDGLCRDVPA